MPNQLSYTDYYSAQMNFIDRFIRKDYIEGDQERLTRIQQLQKQQLIYFLDDFLNIEKGKELETTRIGYKPLESAHYTPQQLNLAPPANQIKSENRRLSRYRLVYGPVDFYLGSQLEESTRIPVITACAPNLMGSSPGDLDEFSTGGSANRQLKVDAYEKECQKLADFIVGAAKHNGQERLIMPAFGVGVYINKLNPHSKDLARKAMFKAFAQAAEHYQLNIDWIVWSGDRNPQEAAQKLSSYVSGNAFMRPVVHADMMLYAQELLEENNEKVVLLNPGSDRTIGGAYTHKNPKTLEEQMAQQSDLVLLHSEFNKPMVAKFKDEFAARKRMQHAEQEPVSPQPNLKRIANQINAYLEIIDKTWISEHDGNYKVSFKSKEKAQEFSALLASNDILGRSNLPKTVQTDRSYHVVYLTAHQLEKIPTLRVNIISALEEDTLDVPQGRPDLERNSPSMTNISMVVLGGFIAAAGIAAVAIAFTVLNAATLGIPGLVTAAIGAAAVLSGIGLFATELSKSRNTIPRDSMSHNNHLFI